MKALTLHQPWAFLIALGVKSIETRSWSTSYRGPLAIHAGKKVVYGPIGDYYAETWFSNVRHIPQECYCDDGVGPPCSRGATRTPVLTRRPSAPAFPQWIPLDMYRGDDGRIVVVPAGFIVATCTLVDVVPIIAHDSTVPDAWMPHVADAHFNGQVGLRFWDGEDHFAPTPRWKVRNIEDQRPYGDFSPGRYAWLLDDIKPLDLPPPAKGRLGLWTWEPGIRREA